MLNIRRVALCAAMGLAVSGFTLAPVGYAGMDKTVEVGGAPMFPSKNIVENAVNSKGPHDARCGRQGGWPRRHAC